MNDIQSFVAEIMNFITDDEVPELSDKAGVNFKMSADSNKAECILSPCGCGGEPSWEDLCYICCWVGLMRPLPGSIHNRMVLGEPNQWTRIYLSHLESSKSSFAQQLFELAS